MSENEERLLELVSKYQAAARDAAERLRVELGVEQLLASWRAGRIERTGRLPSGTEYEFHGSGCWVSAPGALVDFDFGPGERVDGFDVWRLELFAQENHIEVGFDLRTCFDALLKDGVIENPGWAPSPHLYYLRGHRGAAN